MNFEYFSEPTFEPLLQIPPGKGVTVKSTASIALIAASVACNVLSGSSPMSKRFPPATPFFAPNSLSIKNSPSITGIFHSVLPYISTFSSKPSPKYRKFAPVLKSSSYSSIAQNAAVVGHVNTHCPILFSSCLASFFFFV